MNPLRAFGRIWNRLVGRRGFDGEACIRLLRDHSQPTVERDAAAESLAFYPTRNAVDALYEVAAADSEDAALRETAANSLGAIWSEIGLDHERLSRLPEDLQFEVIASMPSNNTAHSDLNVSPH